MWWQSFSLRFVGLYTLMAVVVLAVSVLQVHAYHREQVTEKIGQALESSAATAAPFINAHDLLAIHNNQDVESREFKAVSHILEQIQRENGLDRDTVYVLRADEAARSHLEFVVMLHEHPFVGHYYEPPDSIAALYTWVYERQDAVRTPLYEDDHGTWISGIAPIIGADGKTMAVLQVDHRVDHYIEEVDRQDGFLMTGAGLILSIILLLGLWAHRTMNRRVPALLGGTKAIREQDYDYLVEVSSSDELGAGAQSLPAVIRDLKERFEMLKFLPRHTAKMIQEAAGEGGVHLDMGRMVDVVVMESDIRGFTKLSGSMTPGAIIHMLNTYIRVQAELIERHGGSIDKYMGDAVLAIFEGPEKEARALSCAFEIQRSVSRMNTEKAFDVPIHIGIGLSVGEVVMGNMGSEQRMEHTVIGSTVNLAARLCSAARADQVVVSSGLLDAIEARNEIKLGAPEQVQVKGFAKPVCCYRIAYDWCKEGAPTWSHLSAS